MLLLSALLDENNTSYKTTHLLFVLLQELTTKMVQTNVKRERNNEE